MEEWLMRVKKELPVDDRKVAIYARKSVITHKGDSINNQEKYCKDYAKMQLQLSDDYEFVVYKDEGKSGAYKDRDQFQAMIEAVDRGEIKAIVCYKLDRLGRKLSDLTDMLDFLQKHNTDLLISSNNLIAKDAKFMIQMLGVIAEFERDIIAERIQDNLAELAKNGQWLGGVTPTGFGTEKIVVGSGKRKITRTQLVTISEEKILVQRIFEMFLCTRSFHATAVWLNRNGIKTKKGAEFTTLAVKDIIRNPVYCMADDKSYSYFYEKGGKLYGEIDDYDGFHGLSVYNRTEQNKLETDNSTFLHPEYTKITKQNDISEWIIAVGQHEGFIKSDKWIEAQEIRDTIADKYSRPHRATNALLSGLLYCPVCGDKLKVIPESNRYTNGKPRFKYACGNAVRKGECTYKAVRGVELDEFVLKKLSSLSDREEEYYIGRLQESINKIIKENGNEKEKKRLQKEISSLETSITNQVRHLRSVSEEMKGFFQDDIDDLGKRLSIARENLSKLETLSQDAQAKLNDFEGIKTLLMSFDSFLNDCEVEEQIKLIHSVIERIYVVRDGDKESCHIFIKGCKNEEYSDFFELSDTSYLDKSEMCDLEGCRKLYPYFCRSAIKS